MHNRMLNRYFITLTLTLLLLAGCGANTTTPTAPAAEAAAAPTAAPAAPTAAPAAPTAAPAAPTAAPAAPTAASTTLASAAQPTYVPVPAAAKGPAIPEKGYLVEEIKDKLYYITDGTYQMMFLVSDAGVIVVDAPQSLGTKILPAIAEVTDKPITHVIYSHAHADHVAAMSIYPPEATYIAQHETARLIEESNLYNLPRPTETFDDKYTLTVGDQTLELAYYGINHQVGETFIYAPKQRVLMHIDLVFPGWAPFKHLAVAQDIPAFIKSFDQTLAYDFDYLVAGHLGRLGTRKDVEIQRQYVLDLKASAAQANQSVDYLSATQGVDPANTWAQFNTFANAVTKKCMELMPKHYLTELGGADVFLEDNCFTMSESLRIDLVQ